MPQPQILYYYTAVQVRVVHSDVGVLLLIDEHVSNILLLLLVQVELSFYANQVSFQKI